MKTRANSLVSSRLIGRQEESGLLSRALAEAAQGAGQCILIAGEAGIGKTRLVEELRRGFQGRVVEGQCYEEEITFAFAPLQAALRGLLETADRTEAEALDCRAGILARLLPELADRSSAHPAAGEEGDPAASQRALFEAVAGLFFDLAACEPLLVVFEDLHWSDESTLAFIRFLVRRLRNRAILLIGTYRPDAVPVPVADLLATLERANLAEQITLAPLSRAEVDGLLRSIFDSAEPISADFLDAVTAFSEGNPFYVEELMAAMIRAGDIYQVDGVWVRKAMHELRVPRNVQEGVRRRTEELAPEARRVLTLAAVAGRKFDFGVLAQVTGLGESNLVARLKELIGAGFISEERPDTFAFRHPLLREAVQEQLLARERRALHGQVAAALERLHGAEVEAHAPELAYHYYEAAAWEQALPYARRAGEQAQRLDATREALSQFTRALDCAQHLGGEAPLDLLLARAELYERAGEFDAADADLTATLQGAEQTGRLREAWQALLRLGYLWAARDYDCSLAWFERSLAAAQALDDPLAQAETLNRIGNVYLNRDRPDEALSRHQAAFAVFESAGDLAGQANTLELMGVSNYNLPDVLAGAACEERALALARAAGARSIVFHASIHLLLPLRFETEVGPPVDSERLIQLGEEALAFARAMDWPAGESQALGLLGGFHGLLGDYDRALGRLHEGLQLAEQLDHAAGMAAAERLIASVLLDLLAFDQATERLRRSRMMATGAGALLFADIATLTLAQTLAVRGGPGDLAEAGDLLSGLLTGQRPAGGRNAREALGVRAELELAQGKAAAALDTLEPLIATTRHLTSHGLAAIPRLALLLGRALAAAGRLRDAEDALQAALSGAAAQGRSPLLWRTHAALGRLRLDLKQRRAAQNEFGRARALITELAAAVPDPTLRADFVRSALATIPLPPAPTQRRLETQAHHGLTVRERSVAALVARGHTNREIADALIISERTAERHVANILAKLGLTSRVQLAAWAVQNLPSA